jgi:hypothetical protein
MKYLLIAVLLLLLLIGGYVAYQALVGNPGVEQDIRNNPDGERAARAMLITLPSGATIPVNYLREGNRVYAGADGRWWRELRGEGDTVKLFIKGESLTGHGRAIEDDPEHRSAVFDRLRPTAPKIFGTLVQIELLDTPAG